MYTIIELTQKIYSSLVVYKYFFIKQQLTQRHMGVAIFDLQMQSRLKDRRNRD